MGVIFIFKKRIKINMQMPFLIHCSIALKSGCRNNQARLLFFLSIAVLFASWIAGSFSAREPQTVSLDIGISLIRLLCTILALFWTQELTSKEIERKTVLWSCAYPQARSAQLFGRYAAINILNLVTVAALSIILFLYVKFVAPDYIQPTPPNLGAKFALTCLYIAIDIAVLTAFTTLISVSTSTPMMPFFLGGAYAISARSIGFIREYLHNLSGQQSNDNSSYTFLLDKIALILPDLSRLDIRALALYNSPYSSAQLLAPLITSLCTIIVYLILSAFIYERREFN